MCDSQFCDSQQQFGCTNMSTISSSTVAESSTASVMIAKRERRLRLEKVGSYRVGRVLGRGNFAQVRIAYHEIANAKVAMKIVDKQSLDTENLTKIEREIKILQKLNHPFIVKLYEVIRTNRYLYIVMEYVSNGELFDMLMDGGRQTEIESRRIFQQIVSAVAYCHSNEIVHRDLKAENLLLDKKGNIKLIDFGFSNYQQPSQLLSTWCGSPPYAAPELLLAQEYDGHLSDVWSLGVILYILVTAGFPFPGDSVEKLKRAVLSDHLKIPFWVSVECADLIRKMLTISPAKRYNLQQVVQHRWFCAGKMPEQIKMLLMSSLNKEQTKEESVTISTPRPTLDPTVLVFMQQHTGWSDEQISEEVLTNNYEAPIFATYELLLARLSEFRSAEAAAAALINNNISTGTFAGIGTNFVALENEQTRRGSRGSIISGKANIAQNETQCATIPTHHLAKLSLSTSPDYDSDDSDSTNDLVESMSNDDFTSLSSSLPFMQSQHAQQRSPNIYKSRRRVYRRSQTIAEKNQLLEQQQILNRQRFPYTLEYQQLNPLLNAVAQQFAVDTTRAWANAAAAAALFASQIQQQNNNGGSSSETAALQQAAALNLVSLQNFPFVDYARMIHVPNQERRASANEALLGLNSYAHLLAACSTMGVGSGGGTGSGGPDTRCSSSQGTSSSPRQGPSTQSHRSSCHQQSRRSVEEEGESYLIGQRGANKRNTVHSITNGLPILVGQGTSSLISGSTFQQRHNRTMPYFKQILGDERRSSWASSCSPSFAASSVAAALAINAQQQAQLERLYKQSIAQANAAAVGATAESTASSALSSVQQLQLEFQKLYASTKEGSPGPGGVSACVGNSPNSLFIGGLMNVDQGPLFMKTALVQQQIQHQQQMPTINITDENNQNIESLETNSLLSKTDSNIVGGELPFSQQSTLSNVLSGIGNPSTLGISQTDIGNNQTLKFVYIPICIETAIQRLQKFVQNRQLLCEVQCDELKGKLVQNVNSVRIRIATSSSNEFINNKSTIVELILYRIDQSPNISKALFTHIQGEDINEYEQLRINLLSIFNEVF